MSIGRPYRQTVRQLRDGTYAGSGNGRYVRHPRYADAPRAFVRAYQMLEKDLHHLFEYIEPADSNEGCFSYRVHALLLRAAIEVEANFKAILRANGDERAVRGERLNVERDYHLVQTSHRLASYVVDVSDWRGANRQRKPFASWASSDYQPLAWYQAYNETKHDRHVAFESATFEHCVDSIAGCLVLLSAQYATETFDGGADALVCESNSYGDDFEVGVGGRLRVRFPTDTPAGERYSFDWAALRRDSQDPFQNYPYDAVRAARAPAVNREKGRGR